MDSKKRYKAARIVNTLGTPEVFFFLTLSVTLAFLWFGYQKNAFLFVFGLVVTVGIVGVLKYSLRIARPRNALIKVETPAFPSGHAAGSVFFALSTSYFSFQYIEFVLALLFTAFTLSIAGAVSASRVMLRAHTSLQVFVGVFIGVAVPLTIFFYQESIVALVKQTAL